MDAHPQDLRYKKTAYVYHTRLAIVDRSNESMNAQQHSVYVNCQIATFDDDTPYGLIADGALVVEHGRIAWVGERNRLPREYSNHRQISLDGRLMTPALIDCHTHLIYGGNRAREFELRLEGASYEEIARAGGGIRSTVAATRSTSMDDLVKGALPRVDALLAEGVCTLEIKSGYGLDLETERKMLMAARQIAHERRVHIKTTFLGAHALPEEYADRPDAYIDYVAGEVLPTLADEGLVDCVDAFCEGIAFSPEQVERVFAAAQKLGLPVKLHAEQLSDLKGARLACQYNALSVDHLEYLHPDDSKYLAESGTVAVLLPGAFYFLRETQLPPLDALRDAGVAMAIATDANPGSSPLTSLLLAMNMACTLFRMTPAEVLRGVTRNAAAALGVLQDRGTLTTGKQAELAIWNVETPGELAYRIGFNPLHERITSAS